MRYDAFPLGMHQFVTLIQIELTLTYSLIKAMNHLLFITMNCVASSDPHNPMTFFKEPLISHKLILKASIFERQ
jgi:hypothetical protein